MARALVVAVALLLSATATARAADPQGYYTIQGVGLENCEVWLGERLSDGPTAWYHQQWVLGYITAFNRWWYQAVAPSNFHRLRCQSSPALLI